MTTLSALPWDSMPPRRPARGHVAATPAEAPPAPELDRLADMIRAHGDDLATYAQRVGGWAQLGLMLGICVRAERHERQAAL